MAAPRTYYMKETGVPNGYESTLILLIMCVNKVTIDWWDTNQGFVGNGPVVLDSSGNPKDYTLSNYWDNVNHKNRKIEIADVVSDLNVTVTYSADWLFNSEHTPWMKDVSIAGSGPVYALSNDEEFNLHRQMPGILQNCLHLIGVRPGRSEMGKTSRQQTGHTRIITILLRLIRKEMRYRLIRKQNWDIS